MKMKLPLSFAAAMLAVSTPIMAHAAGDVARGKAIFARCAACHSLHAGKNLAGPSLNGVFARKAGTLGGFTYSPAMKKYGVTWNAQTIDPFLAAPMKIVPGTKMVFAGLPNATDRADLITYLLTATK